LAFPQLKAHSFAAKHQILLALLLLVVVVVVVVAVSVVHY
jgi:hypothetical protein